MLTNGVDIIFIPRVANAIELFGDKFLNRVFTPDELRYARRRVPELAVRFAAKEAVSKALGVGMRVLSPYGIYWHDAEIIGDRKGKPLVRLNGRALQLSQELGLTQWAVSLTHERDYGIAFVTAM
jgi:holo-[acyl-carrier protein] synthase